MEELSNFLDVSDDAMLDPADGDEDEDDYIPESLASFVAEANRKLADAKFNFLTDEQETDRQPISPSHNNQSMDTTTNSVILMEDDDDIRLKKEVLGRLRSSAPASSSDPTGNDTAASVSAAYSTPTGKDIAKKELFPAGSSFDEEDTILEKDIASFFQVNAAPPMPSQGMPYLTKKTEPETDQESPTEGTTTPAKQQMSMSSQKSTTGSSSSFWGNLTSKFVGTPVTAKATSGSSSPVKTSKDQVAPDPSDVIIQMASELKLENASSDVPSSPCIAAEEAPAATKQTLTANTVDSSPVSAPASKQPGQKSINVSPATNMSPPKVKNATHRKVSQKSPPGSAFPPKDEKKPKKPSPARVVVQEENVISTKSVKAPSLKSPERVHISPGTMPRPQVVRKSQTPAPAAILPSKLDKPDVDDSNFLPNVNAVRVEKKAPVDQTAQVLEPRTKALGSRLGLSPSGGLGKPAVSLKTTANDTVTRNMASSVIPTRKAATKSTISTTSRFMAPSRSALGQVSTDSENAKKPSSPVDAVAKARERVRQRQLMEKKKKEEEPATGKGPPLVTATRAMRSSNNPIPSASTKATIVLQNPRVGVGTEAKRSAEEERRVRIAEKVRLVGSGTTAAKAPRVAMATRTVRPPIVPTPANGSKNNRPKLTTPKPFHFHGKDPVHPTTRDDSSSVGMTESMHDFMRKGLRHSTPSTSFEKRPKITTPKPFTFVESLPTVNVTPATTMEEKKRSSTLGEKLRDYDKHLRDSGPAIVVNRDEGPTIPMSPKFTPVPIREKPKSTIEREIEIMEYFENHPFKATPILTELPNSGRGLAGVPKVTKKKLTVPRPFRLSTEARGFHSKVHEVPSHDEPVPIESSKTRTRAMSGFKGFNRGSAVSPGIGVDEDECKKQFHARPMPDFKAGSKLTPVLPKRFNSLRANTSKAEKADNIPATIEVSKSTSLRGVRVSPSPLGASVKSTPTFTKSMPFRFASSSRNRPVAGPDEEELKKQFKARPLPISTFVTTSSTASPSRVSRVPSTISISSGPKLATEDRREQREAAMLASRINAELLIREKASIRQRKQEEKHKEEMRMAGLSSPVRLKAASLRAFRGDSDGRRDASQRKVTELSEEEERERIRNFDLRVTTKPSFDLSPTKLY